MPGFAGDDFADNRTASEIQIANTIQDLVTDEFIVEPQPAFIEDFVSADDNCIFKRTAARQAGAAQGFDFVVEAEGPGTCDIRFEISTDTLECTFLSVDCRRVEVDFESEAEILPRAGSKRTGFRHRQ